MMSKITVDTNYNKPTSKMRSGSHTGRNTTTSSNNTTKQRQNQQDGEDRCWRCSKVWTSRVLFLLVLCGATVALGYGANRLQSDAEAVLARKQFESIAERALHEAQDNARRKRFGAVQLASVAAFAVPEAATWPFANIPGYQTIASNVIRSTNAGASLALLPLVTPQQLAAFEDFAYDVVFAEQNFPNGTGESSFGRGVYGLDASLNNTDNRFHETEDGSTPWGSPNRIFTPFLYHSEGPVLILMGNYRTFEDKARLVDDMIACAQTRAAASNISSVECSILDPAYIPSWGPSAITMQPIYPARDPTILTGIITSSIAWSTVLEKIFSNTVSGVDCVLRTATLQEDDETGQVYYTFHISHGEATLKGEGDLHSPRFAAYRKTIALTSPGMFSDQSPTYSLSLYPTDEFFHVYTTANPVIATVGSVCIIIFTSILFLLYDFFVRQESHHKRTLLQAKRQFIRFVSHEVRTPLNAACLGLLLIHEELEESTDSMADDDKDRTKQQQQQQQQQRSSSKVDDDKKSDDNNAVDPGGSVPKDTVKAWLKLSDEIHGNTQAAVDVLNDLLNYDKIESGTLEVEFAILPFWQLVEETVHEFKLSALQKDVNLLVDFSDLANAISPTFISTDEECGMAPSPTAAKLSKALDCHVVGDRIRLVQVLRNLVSNGLKFTPEKGNLTVRLSWKPSSSSESGPTMTQFKLSDGEEVSYEKDGSVQIEVIDTGAGMSPDQVSRLFQAGVQFNVNELQAGQGSGLGLYISKGIVEQHGGKLEVSSEGLGCGTTFTCTLPLHRVPRHVDDDGSSETTHRSDSPAKLKEMPPLRVLVVEDVAMNRKMLVRLLEKRGHTVFEAVDGQEAIDKVKQATADGSPFDTVLMDYEMPVMNGPLSSKGIRELGCDSFIVGVTGNLLEDDVLYFKSCGANAVLPKPLDFTELENLWIEYGVANESRVYENGQFCKE